MKTEMNKNMKIKFENSYSGNYMIYDFNFENHNFKLIEDKRNQDIALGLIIIGKNYNELINWIRSRVGGKSLKEAIEIAKNNKLKSVKDDILVEIL